MDQPMYVKMLGKFHISHNGNELSESKLKMKQLLTLLTYLIYNRDKHLNLDSIYGVLWPNEDSDNPAHALRNLIYRIRTLLKQHLDADANYILTLDNNSYCWNQEIEAQYDFVEFERHIRIASDSRLATAERIDHYLQAFDLYEDDFLTSLSSQDWIIPVSTYYRHLYNTAAGELTELLVTTNRLNEALKVCLKATEIDPFNERLHQHIIEIYKLLDQSELATRHYQYIVNLFYKELGVELSQETKEVYNQMSEIGARVEVDIQAIKRKLLEDDDLDIPLFCDYHTLKYLYSLQVRNLKRMSDSQFLLLITISTRGGQTPPKAVLDHEMNNMREVLARCLRKNDVVATCSDSQYLLMLSSLTYENSEMVKNRIISDFQKTDEHIEALYSIVSIT